MQEFNRYVNSTGQIAERLGQAIWGDISYGQLVIGREDNIKKVYADEVQRLYYEKYIPECTVLVVVGDVIYDEVLEYANYFFGDWEDKLKMKNEYFINNNLGIYTNTNFSGNRSNVCIGFNTYPADDISSSTVEIIKEYLISVEGNLFQEIREKRVLIYNLDGFNTILKYNGNIGLSFTADNDNIEEIGKIISDQLEIIKLKNFSDKEIEPIIKRKEISLLMAVESNHYQMRTIGKSAILGNIYPIENEIRQLKKNNSKTFSTVLNEIIQLDNVAIATLGKFDIEKLLVSFGK